MPLQPNPVEPGNWGTNSDASLSETYCKYCFQNGVFTDEYTFDQMVERCVLHIMKSDIDLSKEQATERARVFLQNLDRWAKYV